MILLTDEEIKVAVESELDENFFKDRPPRYGIEYFVAKAQLKKVGEGLEKVMRVKVLTDDDWVYTIPKSFVEALLKEVE